MKAPDTLLVSLALGLTLLNVVALTSGNATEFESPLGSDPLAPTAPRNPNLRHLVLHDFDAPHAGFPFHFVIGDGSSFPDGAVVPTERWRRQEGGAFIEIALAAGRTEKQERALLELIDRLRRDYGMTAGDVGTHRELEPASRCPQSLDGDRLRERINSRP